MSSRVHAEAKSSSTPIAGFKVERPHLLHPHEVEQAEPDTASLDNENKLSTSDQPNPLPPPPPPINHHFGQVSVQARRSPVIQYKLAIGQPGDKYEQEADRVADQVMRMPEPGSVAWRITNPNQTPAVQRVCAECEDELQEGKIQKKAIATSITPLVQRQAEVEEEEEIQRKSTVGNSLTASTLLQRQVTALQGNGQPLTLSERSFFEPRFNADFSKVRLHTNPHAAEIARSVNARAFTFKQNIVFGTGEYKSSSPESQSLLAHELTHVLQQSGVKPLKRTVQPKRFKKEYSNSVSPPSIQRICSQCQEDKQTIQAKKISSHISTAYKPVNNRIQFTKISSQSSDLILQRNGRTEAESITEQEVRTLLNAEEQQERAEISPEEETNLSSPSEEPPPGSIETEAEAVQTEGPQQEITIPEFDTGASSDCPQLIPEDISSETEGEGDGTREAEADEGFFSELLSFAPSSLLGGIPFAIAGAVSSAIWRRLPLSIRAAAVNRAIDVAISGVSALPGRDILGNMWGWFQAGLTAFLKRLKSVEDSQKVAIFEKIGSIALGRNLSFLWGYAKGLIKGFFLDGLVGIVQMIIDIICMVPKILKFFEAIGRFLGNLPEEMAATVEAIRDLSSAIDAAIQGAAGELVSLLRSPGRIVELLNLIYSAGESLSRQVGEKMAETLIQFWSLPAARLGEKIGRIAGQLVFEVVAAFLTAGGGAAVTATKIAVRATVKIVGMMGRRAFQIIRIIGNVIDLVKDIVIRAKKFLTRLFRAVVDKLYQVMERILDIFHSFTRRCRPGSYKCRVPRRRGRQGPQVPGRSQKCRGRFVPRLGGFRPHDRYCASATGRTSDFRIVLGPVLRCTYDAKVGRELIECKTGYGWLQNPQVQAQPWFPWAVARLDAQRYRCLLTASRCGYIYKWYMKNRGAAAYLTARWNGIPPVLHRP